jgi:hypothetical protein
MQDMSRMKIYKQMLFHKEVYYVQRDEKIEAAIATGNS